MSYYSIDDIETDGIKVPIKFNVTSPGLGFLMPQTDRNSPPITDIPAGANLVLPLWLATPLASATVDEISEEAFLEMREPAALRQDVLDVLKSEPMALDLRSQNKQFINLALVWTDLFASNELARVMFDTVRIRAAYVFDAALSRQGADPKLDEYETSLFASASRAVRDLKKWYLEN